MVQKYVNTYIIFIQINIVLCSEKAWSLLMEGSIDVADCYCEVVKEGFSEIRRKVVTQDVDTCNWLHADAVNWK